MHKGKVLESVPHLLRSRRRIWDLPRRHSPRRRRRSSQCSRSNESRRCPSSESVKRYLVGDGDARPTTTSTSEGRRGSRTRVDDFVSYSQSSSFSSFRRSFEPSEHAIDSFSHSSSRLGSCKNKLAKRTNCKRNSTLCNTATDFESRELVVLPTTSILSRTSQRRNR
jgi:hypothetical protein